MKKMIALFLTAALALMIAACGAKENSAADEAAADPTQTVSPEDEALKADCESYISENNFEGIIYVMHGDTVVYESATGTDEEDEALTIDTSLYVGSVSKQFCATAIMLLRDRGKLSVNDTLDKYFPAYPLAKELTIKNLLTMRSGIPDMVNEGAVEEISPDNTEEENVAVIKKWIFSQKLKFDPDSEYAYSNSNYFLLSDIVEQVSGQYYNTFLRENIFEPLGMDHTGLLTDIPDHPAWCETLIHDENVQETAYKGIARGAGDIVTNAPDMGKWMQALSGGKIVSAETYGEMTADYSPDYSPYGYGLTSLIKGGSGHFGRIASYAAVDYMNVKDGYCFFSVSNKLSMSSQIDAIASVLLSDYISE